MSLRDKIIERTEETILHTFDVKKFIKKCEKKEVIDEYGVGWIRTKDILKEAGEELTETKMKHRKQDNKYFKGLQEKEA